MSKDTVLEIYNNQNSPITRSELDQFVGDGDVEFVLKHHTGIYKAHFISFKVDFEEDFETIQEIKKGKPYYIPDQEELLKYDDAGYFEENEAYEATLTF